MSKKADPPKEIGNGRPFKVPEGYFEGLSNRIMSQLPERTGEPPKRIPLWGRVQPWMYLAAMVCGMALMVNLFIRTPRQPASHGLNLSSSTDIEEFYQYYEEQLTSSLYNDALYADVE